MIYFIQYCENGPIKIGFAKDSIGQRMTELQIGCPFDLKLLGYVDGSRKKEAKIHRKFKRFALRGEWFSPDMELLAYIARKSLGTIPPDVTRLKPLCYKLPNKMLAELRERAIRDGVTMSSITRKAVTQYLALSDLCQFLQRSPRHRLQEAAFRCIGNCRESNAPCRIVVDAHFSSRPVAICGKQALAIKLNEEKMRELERSCGMEKE